MPPIYVAIHLCRDLCGVTHLARFYDDPVTPQRSARISQMLLRQMSVMSAGRVIRVRVIRGHVFGLCLPARDASVTSLLATDAARRYNPKKCRFRPVLDSIRP